jgi:hypothetical protein
LFWAQQVVGARFTRFLAGNFVPWFFSPVSNLLISFGFGCCLLARFGAVRVFGF